jgi:Fic family protein
MKDTSGIPFTYWLPDPALAVLHEIDRWGGGMLMVEEETVPSLDSMKDRVVVSSLMEEAIATSQIEGAVTTRRVAKEMLRTNRPPRDRSEQMIVNSYRTIQLLRDRIDQPLSLGLLNEIQASMTQGTLEDPSGAGRFRAADEEITVIDCRDNEIVYTPPPADELPERIEKLVDFANSTDTSRFIHPLVKAAILHFWLAYEHPYVDGNGRTARALFYWFMLKQGYWLFEFLTISRIIHSSPMQYYRSFLYTEQDDNDLTYSITYQLNATKKALGELRKYIREKQAEQAKLSVALRKFPELNERQRALLDHAIRHPNQVYTFVSHQRSNRISYPTAHADLVGLARVGLLDKTKLGKRRGFLPAKNLAKKLEIRKRTP